MVANPISPSEVAELTRRLQQLEVRQPEDRLCICVFSNDLDKQIAALTLATGAAAMGTQVFLFYTFWGLAALRDPRKRVRKGMVGRMFGWMLPTGPRRLKLSKMHMAGLGSAMMRRTMKKKNAATLEDLYQLSAEMGVQIRVCSLSQELLEISTEELVDYPGLEHCGVACFMETAAESRTTLFI